MSGTRTSDMTVWLPVPHDAQNAADAEVRQPGSAVWRRFFQHRDTKRY